MKKYLRCVVIKHDGTQFLNPLKLSEAHIISKLAQENRKIVVSLEFMSLEEYRTTFT